MNVIIGVIITFLVVILVLYLVNMLPIDGRAKQIVRVIVIIIGVISLLKYLAVFQALAAPRRRRGRLGAGRIAALRAAFPPDRDNASSRVALHASLIEASLAASAPERTRPSEAG